VHRSNRENVLLAHWAWRWTTAKQQIAGLPKLRQGSLDPREYRGLFELREYPLCLGQMLNRKGVIFPDFVE
jgi:hypothetical protein